MDNFSVSNDNDNKPEELSAGVPRDIVISGVGNSSGGDDSFCELQLINGLEGEYGFHRLHSNDCSCVHDAGAYSGVCKLLSSSSDALAMINIIAVRLKLSMVRVSQQVCCFNYA